MADEANIKPNRVALSAQRIKFQTSQAVVAGSASLQITAARVFYKLNGANRSATEI